MTLTSKQFKSLKHPKEDLLARVLYHQHRAVQYLHELEELSKKEMKYEKINDCTYRYSDGSVVIANDKG